MTRAATRAHPATFSLDERSRGARLTLVGGRRAVLASSATTARPPLTRPRRHSSAVRRDAPVRRPHHQGPVRLAASPTRDEVHSVAVHARSHRPRDLSGTYAIPHRADVPAKQAADASLLVDLGLARQGVEAHGLVRTVMTDDVAQAASDT